MKYFTQLECPVFDLSKELASMLDSGIIHFRHDLQISLNTTQDEKDNYFYGNGSLRYDWDKQYYDEEQEKMIVPEREKKGLREWHFDTLCTQFVGTEFERVYNYLSERYKLGRVRIMKMDPRTVMSWHKDSTTRIHYPIRTQEGCKMVIEDEVMHLPADTLWHTDTLYSHTAFNASMEPRIHLVAAILE